MCAVQAGVLRCLQTAPGGPAALGTSGLEGPGRLRPYSKVWNLRNREIETETLIFAPISLSYIEID